MGDYAVAAPPNLLLTMRYEQHPTDKTDLHGARLCVASEVEEGRLLAEAEVKLLTGGDPNQRPHDQAVEIHSARSRATLRAPS